MLGGGYPAFLLAHLPVLSFLKMTGKCSWVLSPWPTKSSPAAASDLEPPAWGRLGRGSTGPASLEKLGGYLAPWRPWGSATLR